MEDHARRYRIAGMAQRRHRFAGAWLSCLLIIVLAATPASNARPQSLLSGDEQNVVNFAFATQLGSGVYSVSDRTLQIYRLPFSHALKTTDDSSFGVELTLPVTFGFFEFELQDVADGEIPTHVDALSFVPGLKFVFDLQPGWKLEPYFEAGISRARDANAHASVYAAGLASLYEFDGKGFDWLLRNELVFAGVDLHGVDGSDDFARLQTVLAARRPFSRESRADYLVYALNEYYIDQPDGPVGSAAGNGDSVQYEIGITLGSPETLRLWGIPLPRIGIGYRFGSNLDIFRIVIGAPY